MSSLGLSAISHAFDGRAVVRGLDAFVPQGKLVCLLGPSGCGKTTLLRIAAGLEALQAGRVAIGERVVADADLGRHVPPEQRGVGLMFQDYALFPHLTVLDNVVFGVPRGRPERRAWARQALERLGLGRYARSFPHVLSGGEQQRAALLRALAPEPSVLLLDEPFSGLDATLRAQVREETLALLKDLGMTTLMVTHDPEEAMFMAEEMLVMSEGRVVQSGTPYEIYFRPLNAFVAGLFGPLNRISGVVEGGRVVTALGAFPLARAAGGGAVEVLIRPEGLRPDTAIGEATGGRWRRCPAPLRVVSAHLLGRSTQLRMRLGDGDDLPLQARVPGAFLPAAGDLVPFSVDERQVFVFAEE
jgi:iron(III) transport system ATP-binding protein